jgi:BirA family transcriptional regulator, biotin operon repressor / biotin---[acetyl-CoA-carboxylase] ligase
MDQDSLESALADLYLPAIRFYHCIDSTNAEALKWIINGAQDKALVVADEQTAGRGRFNHRWVTVPGAALALSLIMLPPQIDQKRYSRFSGLGAVSVREVLYKKYALPAQIKWPNDILIGQKKVGGVLVDVIWSGETLRGLVIGIGINIAPESVSAVNLPSTELNFPATCVENELGHSIDRLELLHAILQELLAWLPRLSLPDFIIAWESNLAFRGQWVEISRGDSTSLAQNGNSLTPSELRKVIGLSPDGSLRVSTKSGELLEVAVGEIHLQPSMMNPPVYPKD